MATSHIGYCFSYGALPLAAITPGVHTGDAILTPYAGARMQMRLVIPEWNAQPLPCFPRPIYDSKRRLSHKLFAPIATTTMGQSMQPSNAIYCKHGERDSQPIDRSETLTKGYCE